MFFGEARRVSKRAGRAIVSSMHPAMLLRGTQARFTDPSSGEIIQPGSFPHQISDMVMSAVRAGFILQDLTEHAADELLATNYPRAQKYLGWPMLLVMALVA
jgi:malonyl-CoA O-methyltransferase